MLCDFAEYYHIYDLEALPVRKLAALSCGLPPDSRTMRNVTGAKLSVAETLLAACCDNLAIIAWMNSEDGRKNRNRPKSILSELTTEKEKPMAYTDGAAFMAARDAILGGGAIGD